MACRQQCKKYEYDRHSMSNDVYENGGRWCSICEKYVKLPGIFCLCCGQQFRKNPRSKHGKTIKMMIDSKRIK